MICNAFLYAHHLRTPGLSEQSEAIDQFSLPIRRLAWKDIESHQESYGNIKQLEFYRLSIILGSSCTINVAVTGKCLLQHVGPTPNIPKFSSRFKNPNPCISMVEQPKLWFTPSESKAFSYVLTVFFLLTHEKNYRPPAKATWLHLALASFTKFLLSAWTYCMIMMVKMRRKKNSRRTPYFVIAKQGLAKSSTSWCSLQLPPANRIQAATLWIQCHSCKESSAISSANLCLVKSHCH